ncbi:MAG: OmpA family protein [Luteolibacter sp.]
MQRSKIPYIFLALAALIAASAIGLLFFKIRSLKDGPSPSTSSPGVLAPPAPEPVEPKPDPDEALQNPGKAVASSNPDELVGQIAKSLAASELPNLGKLFGEDILDEPTIARLKAFLGDDSSPLKIRSIQQVGELELNQLARWAIEFEGREPGKDRVYLDLRRRDGKWHVEKLTLPPAPGESAEVGELRDALGAADSFLQTVLAQKFVEARQYVNPATVSDAKIAGLCIIFEEGQYSLRANKPLRAMFQRPDTVGYLAQVETTDAAQSAQFALTLIRSGERWLVSEINLDALLSDYAKRVAGGDIYFSPLVKNPSGGDTLVLYFGFDEDGVNPRTSRQLSIVAQILKADPGKKIHLTGHTDALGPDDYNNNLSARRAATVREYLVKAGVSASQISVEAEGSRQPRRPNVTETGIDNPEGRRANRRTEIYLDF